MQILGSQSFSDTFGGKTQRKRPKVAVDSYEELLQSVSGRGSSRTPSVAAQPTHCAGLPSLSPQAEAKETEHEEQMEAGQLAWTEALPWTAPQETDGSRETVGGSPLPPVPHRYLPPRRAAVIPRMLFSGPPRCVSY